ncbi:MAG: preprotein translocase subunit SecG [Gemmataceae bacterium]|nr:preprotein translocase subunit SecG [Gemmataceae bacterium]
MELLAAAWYSHAINVVVLGIGLLLMLLVLIQRGKGGGLAGAFGGAGGSSPFGSRAADQFVKITLWLAGVWVLVIMIHVKVVQADIAAARNKPAAQLPTETPKNRPL